MGAGSKFSRNNHMFEVNIQLQHWNVLEEWHDWAICSFYSSLDSGNLNGKMGVAIGDINNCTRKLYIREGLSSFANVFSWIRKKLPIREHFLSRIIPIIRYACERIIWIWIWTRVLKNKIFKQEIGIAEKSQETRRDRCGGNAVTHKSLFWLSDPQTPSDPQQSVNTLMESK